MKNILFLLSLLFIGTLSAQSSSQSISEVTTDDAYAFSIKLDKDRSPELSAAYLKLIDKAPMQDKLGRFSGKIETTTANDTVIKLNTKQASLKITSSEGNPKSREEAKRYATLLRKELGLEVDAPTPPAPPKN